MTGEPISETLLRAAKLIRERADAASPGPWHQMCMGSEGCSVLNDEHLRDRKRVSFSGRKEWKADHADATYIASMHPLVAAAVAEWLELEAQLHGVRGHNSGEGHTFGALKVARAYLRETDGGQAVTP